MNFKQYIIFISFFIATSYTNGDDLLTHVLDDFVIKSSPLTLNSSEVSQSYCAIENQALDDINSNTIAQTLSFEPGISQTYYGPNANRPIIRGLDGFRVSVLENGLKNFDLSATSNDHAVTINPLLVSRIEILRGSSTLIYGSNSIGGVINVFDNSIPSKWNQDLVQNRFKVRFTSVDNGKNFGGIVYDRIGDILFQVNTSKIITSDYDSPAFELHHHEHGHEVQYAAFDLDNNLTTQLLEHEEHEENEEDEEHEEPLTSVSNTHSETETFGFGGSYSSDNGYTGLGYSTYSSSYGVPNHESSIITIKSYKTSLKSEYDLDSGYFDSLNFSLVHGDYAHSEGGTHEESDATLYEYHTDENEFEEYTDDHDDHGHHASFITEGIDSALVLSKNSGSETTALSLSYSDIDMKIEGEESYLAAMNHYASNNAENQGNVIAESTNPKISNDSAKKFGIGLMRKSQFSDALSFNGGIRYESLSRDYDATERSDHHEHGDEHEDAETVDVDRDDNSLNASAGFVFENSDSLTISGNLHYSERIPETSELFSSGAHHATESFEIGDADLDNEESIGIEFAIASNQGALKQKLTYFYNDYKNFIFQSDSGFITGTDKWVIATDTDELIEEGVTAIDGNYYIKPEFESLAIRQYKGVEAIIYGFEYEFDYTLSSNSYIAGFADTITGKNETDNIALPRIPPYRLGIGYHSYNDQYRFSLKAVHYGKQDNLANGEENTDSYTLLNARLAFLPKSDSNSELYIKVNNLTNRLAYVHTSFLKESSPLPGRNVEIGYNLTF